MGIFKRKAAGYNAAYQVEKHRAAAVELLANNAEMFAQIVAQANGSDAEGAAQRDPVVCVALFMAAMEGAEDHFGPSEPAAPAERDIDYWPGRRYGWRVIWATAAVGIGPSKATDRQVPQHRMLIVPDQRLHSD